MSQRLSPADVVQERLVGTLCTEAARAADRRLHPKPVLILIERTDGRQDQVDRGVGTMAPAGSRRMSHPAHELRELSQLQALPVMVLLGQECPERLQMMCICPYRVWRSPQPMKVESRYLNAGVSQERSTTWFVVLACHETLFPLADKRNYLSKLAFPEDRRI